MGYTIKVERADKAMRVRAFRALYRLYRARVAPYGLEFATVKRLAAMLRGHGVDNPLNFTVVVETREEADLLRSLLEPTPENRLLSMGVAQLKKLVVKKVG